MSMGRFKQVLIKLFCPPAWAAWLSCGAFPVLVWLFWRHYEERWFSYPVYVLSAYALTVLCVRLVPRLLRWAKDRKREEEKTLAPEEKVHGLAGALYQSLAISFAYAAFHLVTAAYQGSVWLASNGVYYLVQTLMYVVLLPYQRKLQKQYDLSLAWKGYTVIGWWLFALNLAMAVLVFQMIWRGEGSSYPGFVVLGVAAFTFYKLTMSIIALARGRRDNSPIAGAVNNMNHTSTLMSLFSLQTALFCAYGQNFGQQRLMNTLTGAAVCLMTVLGALGMVLHGRKRSGQAPEQKL